MPPPHKNWLYKYFSLPTILLPKLNPRSNQCWAGNWNICPQTPNIDRDYSNLTPTVHIIRWISDVYKDHLTPCIDQKGINQHRSANFKHSTNSKVWYVAYYNLLWILDIWTLQVLWRLKDDFFGVLRNGFVSFGNLTEHYFLSQEILPHQYRS